MFRKHRLLIKAKYVIITILSFYLIDYAGIFGYLFELDYNRLFYYPMEGDVLRYAHKLRFNMEIEVEPFNRYNYSYKNDCRNKCLEAGNIVQPELTFIVKSAMENAHRRLAIRKTWGNEKRFNNIIIKTVFILGIAADKPDLQTQILAENEEYQDIVQARFLDNYFNNTIKTMTGFRWANDFCPQSKYFMFVDDDYYVSTKNVLRYLQNPTLYPYINLQPNTDEINNMEQKPEYKNFSAFNAETKQNLLIRPRRKILKNLENMSYKLYVGYVIRSRPHRCKWSKWYITLKEYPYNRWPPYITAGAYLLSREALLEMYFTSMYTQHFRFDDIFLGIVAMKAKIKLKHCQDFYYGESFPSKFAIAKHGYGNPKEMMEIWAKCKAAGYA